MRVFIEVPSGRGVRQQLSRPYHGLFGRKVCILPHIAGAVDLWKYANFCHASGGYPEGVMRVQISCSAIGPVPRIV